MFQTLRDRRLFLFVCAVSDVTSVRVVIRVDDVNDNAPVLQTPRYAWPELENAIVTAIDFMSPTLTPVYMLSVRRKLNLAVTGAKIFMRRCSNCLNATA